MRTKTSTMIPPDPDSLREAIKRVHYQLHYWLSCTKINIEHISYAEFGWKWCKERNIVMPCMVHWTTILSN